MNSQKITFEIADAREVKKERESSQEVSVITDFHQSCAKCKKRVIGRPLSLTLADAVDSKGLHDAQYAVAQAMFRVIHPDKLLGDLRYEMQTPWLKAAGGDGWRQESYSLEAVGFGLSAEVREAGVAEAKKWAAYTDRRQVFRATSAQFPPGWIHLSFQARSGKNGEPVEHAHVGVSICPDCAPSVFEAAGVDPRDPFTDGTRWE